MSLRQALPWFTYAGLALSAIAAPDPSRAWDVHTGLTKGSGLSGRSVSSVANETCPASPDIPVRAALLSPFLALSAAEVESVKTWLYQPEQGLNLTSSTSPNLTQNDNYIWIIEALYPNKTGILNYLDNNEALPAKYARVVINEGGKLVPDVSEYYVGPLPISEATTITTLDYFYSRPARFPFNGRIADGPRSAAIDVIVASTMSSIADITLNLTGLVYYGASDERTNSAYFVQNPTSMDGSNATFWAPFRKAGLAPYDRPSDLYVNFDVSGTDVSTYTMRMIVYNLVVYTSVQDFRDAWTAGKITKTPSPSEGGSFLRKDRVGPVRELENRFAPTTIPLGGKRYKLDEESNYIEYMGWKFYTAFTRDVGLQFFDIKLKGERIMYELSLQDAVAQYAGNNPFQTGTAYSDRFYGIGAQVGSLVPGYDCPYHASYWNATFNSGEGVVSTKKAICIFETDLGHPITRHTDGTYQQVTKGNTLVVRMIATVGNYDYLFDYTFGIDGAITVDVRASGYVQANYYRPDDEEKWGPRIQETIAGTLHTHVINFKADFDLIDTHNTLLKTDIVVENITQPWFPEHGTFEQMRYNFTEIANEDSGILPSPMNGQTMYTVINKNATNKWGVPRGYRIVPGVSNIVLASHNSPFFLKSGQAYKQSFAVTRHHDTEPSSSAALNQNLPMAPPVEFYKFFNGESLVQEDLVAWVNLGMHHYTRSEDIPNTLMTEAHSSVTFAPQNWGDAEGTRDLTNAIIYNAGIETRDGYVLPDTNGVEPPLCFPMSPEDELLGIF